MVWNNLWFLMGVWATTSYYHIWYDHIWWRHSNYHVWTEIVELFNFICGSFETHQQFLALQTQNIETKEERRSLTMKLNWQCGIHQMHCLLPLCEFTFGFRKFWILSFDLKRFNEHIQLAMPHEIHDIIGSSELMACYRSERTLIKSTKVQKCVCNSPNFEMAMTFI